MAEEATPSARFSENSPRGKRLIQSWVPDVHSPEFAAEARRQ
jgi:hypothetical protein